MRLMEVCGTHTQGIFKSGLRDILPSDVRLVSGPGCPVCVTPSDYINKCIEYAMRPDCVLVSFGDMLKVPGHGTDLPHSLDVAKGTGGRIEMVYSPFQILDMAERSGNTTFIIAAVGFETTAPVYALLVQELTSRNISNVKLLTSLRSAVRAVEWICESESEIDGFLCPGHVSVITGSDAFLPLAEEYNKPFVVGGFEPRHIADAVNELIEMVSAGNSGVVNHYQEIVSKDGNEKAMAIIDKYFVRGAAAWRGLGTVPASGFFLKSEYASFDAGSYMIRDTEIMPLGCRCAEVIMGEIDPNECDLFGKACTPSNAVGPCMVSSEGACGIWFRNI